MKRNYDGFERNPDLEYADDMDGEYSSSDLNHVEDINEGVQPTEPIVLPRYIKFDDDMDGEYSSSDLNHVEDINGGTQPRAPGFRGWDLEYAYDMDEGNFDDEISENDFHNTSSIPRSNDGFEEDRKGITPAQLEVIWEVAECCELKEITIKEAEDMMEGVGMNRNTTTFHTNTYKRMRRGQVINATINSKVIDEFLTKIMETYGSEACASAIKSVEDYIAKKPNSKMKKILKVHSFIVYLETID